MSSSRAALATATFSCVSLLTGCGAETNGSPKTDDVELIAGSFYDGDALIAVVRDETGTAAYVCGGPDTFDSWTRWFNAPAGTALRADGWTVSIAATGTSGELIDPAGNTHGWQGRAGPIEGLVGLYSVVDSGCRTGAIVTQRDSDVVVQGVWCDEFGRFGQVTPVYPAEIDRIILSVALSDGDRELIAERVRSPTDLR